MSKVFLGTSGWQYDSWRGPFYKNEDPTIGRYGESFNSVEVNGTFYGLPDRETVEGWRSDAPKGFAFSVKASRYITHMKKLKDPEEPLERFFSAVEPLGDSLGVVLFQLPPKWRRDSQRLSTFVKALPKKHRYAFEFRDPDWHHPETYDILKSEGAAFCIYDFADYESPRETTADFVYVRLHGASEAYRGSYSQESLAGWAGAISSWNRQGKDVYLYFDNDQEAAAPGDAARLSKMLGEG